MTNLQKVIKYLALAFAIYLCVNIFSGIILGISLLVSIGNNSTNVTSNMNVISSENLSNLDIELATTSLEIFKGDTFKIETNNDKIKLTKDDNITKIEEEGKLLFQNDKKVLRVYIPNNITNLKVKIGAGTLNINDLNVNNFNLKTGAGEVKINNLNVTNSFETHGGAGEMDILNSNIYNLDLKLGVGEFDFSGTLKGDNNITSGIGEVDIDLLDDFSNYSIKATKGLGNIKVDNVNISNDATYGNGKNLITIKGGIGEIKVR